VVTAALKGMPITHGVGNMDVDKLIALGYFKVNTGLHAEAIRHFSEMLAKSPTLIAALVGRGTALALIGQFMAAEDDFTKALLLQPRLADGYRRRSQVLGAQGKVAEAIADLGVAVKIEPAVAETYYQRACLFHKLGDFAEAQFDLAKAVELDATQKMYYNSLGLVENALGNCPQAIDAFQKALAMDPQYKDAHYGLGMALRDWGRTTEALASFGRTLELDPDYVNAHHLRSFLHFTLGRHALCWRDAMRVVELDPRHREALFLKALALHDIGQFRKAVTAYDALLKMYPDDSGWYTREICLKLHHLADTPAREKAWDAQFAPVFKEAWCKRTSPLTANLKGYVRQPPLNPSIADVPIGKAQPVLPDAALELIRVADDVGRRLQLNTPGFLANARQHRMGGLAALEAAQVIRDFWDGKCELTWRAMFDIIVQWRQLSEANDPVWWVDQLPEDLFFEGFGLQTPMITGQLKVPKYYSYFPRCFALTKRLLQEQHVLTDAMADKVAAATTCADLWGAMQRDFFVISPCFRLPLEPGERPEATDRTAAERGWMEGTRITLVQKLEERGYQFTIRTPGTPDRYRAYTAELDLLCFFLNRFLE